jgi:hypothetical protein
VNDEKIVRNVYDYCSGKSERMVLCKEKMCGGAKPWFDR